MPAKKQGESCHGGRQVESLNLVFKIVWGPPMETDANSEVK